MNTLSKLKNFFTKHKKTNDVIGFNIDIVQLPMIRIRNVLAFYEENSKELGNCVIVNGLPIPFDKSYKKIVLNLSGGADSSLLLYIMCKIIEHTGADTKIYPATMIRFWQEKPWLEQSARNVYDYCKERFPDIIEEHQWGILPHWAETTKVNVVDDYWVNILFKDVKDMANLDVLFIKDFDDYIVKKIDADAVYAGATTNPDIDIDDEFNLPEFREPAPLSPDELIKVKRLYEDLWTDHKPKYQFKEHWGIDPFALITKEWVMAQYDNFGIQDLLELTRSCEGDYNGVLKKYINDDYETPPECGECFFCKERQWGIDNKHIFLKENNI